MRNLTYSHGLLFLVYFTSNLFIAYSEVSDLRLGGNISYGFNQYNSSFTKLPNVSNCCPKFESGIGNGLTIGLLLDIPIFDKTNLQFRLNYSDESGKFTDEENELMNFSGNIINGVFEHIIDLDIGSYGIETNIGYRVFEDVYISLGGRLGFLSNISFDQKEEITKPSTQGVFLDTDTRVRNDTSGVMNNSIKTVFSSLAAIRYELALDSKNNLKLAPEIVYYLGLSEIFSNSNWTIDNLRFGASIFYSINNNHEKQMLIQDLSDEPIVVNTNIEVPPISADVVAVGLDPKTGNEMDLVKIKIEEFLSTKVKPLLNYIFFENGRFELPTKYSKLNTQEIENFEISNLYNLNVIDTYYQILNIVGKRLNEYQKSSITLVGCNSDEGIEKGNIDLSLHRALEVRNYLWTIWNIDTNRITIKTMNLPSNPSNISKEDGLVENRRVEIYSDNYEVLAPVINFDTIRVSDPPAIRFKINRNGNSRENNSSLIAVQKENQVFKHDIEDLTIPTLDWKLDMVDAKTMSSGKLDYSIKGEDFLLRNFESQKNTIDIDKITIEKKKHYQLGDVRIDEFSLILFDFDSDKINENNQRIIEFIKSYIEPKSKVTIKGFTDRMGDDEHNQKLSEKRAKSVCKSIGNNDEFLGNGENEQIYNNNLPEGRFYSRTVLVTIETPIQWE